jgi:hypothetical protein
MTRSPYVPRPRCWRCKGRRVVVVDHFDHDEIVPCPSCHHTDPSPAGARPADQVFTLARAA